MLELTAQPRQELGKKVKQLRKAGEIPAILYGHNIKSIPLKIKQKEFQNVYQEAGESSIITLKIGNEKKNVLIYEIALDPLTDKIIHIDFYQVRMDEKIATTVPLEFIGVSQAVKEKGGVLVKSIHEIEVQALPQDLPHKIKVDISPLKEFHDNICIKDLLISGKIRILAEPDEIVASVIPPRKEEEEVPPAEEVAEAVVEEAPEATEVSGEPRPREAPAETPEKTKLEEKTSKKKESHLGPGAPSKK